MTDNKATGLGGGLYLYNDVTKCTLNGTIDFANNQDVGTTNQEGSQTKVPNDIAFDYNSSTQKLCPLTLEENFFLEDGNGPLSVRIKGAYTDSVAFTRPSQHNYASSFTSSAQADAVRVAEKDSAYTVSFVKANPVTITDGENGSGTKATYTEPGYDVPVSITSNMPYVAAGDTVTVTPGTPSKGYRVDAVTVTTSSGNVTVNENNTFTMPNTSVTITVTYKLKETPTAAQFTFAAPTNLTYDGTAKTATVKPATGVTGVGRVTVEYYQGTTKLAGAPTDAGDYTVMINVAESAAYAAATDLTDTGWAFTIAPAAQPAPAAPTLTGKTYNSITVTAVAGQRYLCLPDGDPAPTVDTTGWQESGTFTGLKRETGYAIYTYGTENANYLISPVSAGLKVETELEKITAVTAPSNTTLTAYCTTAYEVTNLLPKSIPCVTEGKNSVALSIWWNCTEQTYDAAPGKTNTFEWHARPIWGYTAADDVPMSGTITVTNKAATPVTITGKDATQTYTTSAISVASLFTVDANAGTASYSITGGTGAGTLNGSKLTVTKAGTFTIALNTAATGNYAAGSATATLTVEKAAGSVTEISKLGKTYDGTPVTAPTYKKLGNGAVTIEYKAANEATYTKTAPQNAGSYTVKVTAAADDTYTEASATADFTIAAKALTAAMVGQPDDVTYTGEEQKPAVTVTDGTPNILTASDYTVTYTGNTDVGTAIVTVTAQGNYIGVITKKFEISYLAAPENPYTATTQPNESGWYNADVVLTPADGYTISDTLNGSYNSSLTLTESTGKDAKIYLKNANDQITDGISISGIKIDKAQPTGTIKIGQSSWDKFLNTVSFGLFFKNKQTVTVTAGDQLSGTTVEMLKSDVTYNDSKIATATGWEKRNSMDAALNSAGFFYAKITSGAGLITYLNTDGVVIYTDAEADTKAISYTKATKTDTTATVKLNGNTVAGVKNGKTALTLNTDYTVDGNKLTFKGTYLDGLAAGEYNLTVSYKPQGETYVDATGNDAPATTAITLTVTKKTLTDAMVGQPADAIYTGTEQKPTMTVTDGEPNILTANDYSVVYTDNTDVGTATVTVTAQGNYTGVVTKTFKISYLEAPANPYTVTTQPNESGWYNADVTLKPAKGYHISDALNGSYQETLTLTESTVKDAKIYLKNGEGQITDGIAIIDEIKIDKAQPTGTIAVGTNQWTAFLNKVTFGLFFKDTQTVTVTAGAQPSGTTVEMLKSNVIYKGSEIANATGWEKGDSMSEKPDFAGFFYAKITSGAGLITYLNTEGVVIYTDAEADTKAISYTKATKTDTTATVKLNGNTVAGVKNGKTALTLNTDYTVDGNKLTFKGTYLDGLAAGEYNLTVSYKPQGETYVDATGNDAPATTAITLTVTKKTLTDAMVGQPADAIYTGTEQKPTMTVTDGEPNILTANDYSVVYTDNTDVGTATVTVTAQGNYTGVVTKTFKISYLEAPANPYTVTTQPNESGWYNADVTLKPAKGYHISDALNGSYQETLTLTESTVKDAKIYLKNGEGQITDGIAIIDEIKIDKAQPTGTIAVGTNQWTAFLNKVTFGLFFKDTQTVTVTAGAQPSGTTVEMLKSNVIYKGSEIANATGWEKGDSMSEKPDFAGFFYAKITSGAGLITYLNTEGVVIYTDAEADTKAISYTKATKTDTTATVKLNGNTVAGVQNGKTALTRNTDYTVEGNKITFKGTYLDGLAAGEYTLTVSYNPMGEAYVDATGNDAPATTAITLTVSKADIIKKPVTEPGAVITPTPGSNKNQAAQDKNKTTDGSTTPATGDTLPVIPLLLLLMISGGAILRLNYSRRKNSRTR
ncbi:MAG: X2-like carbohydrate binding domain-containing protein [Oscillospiraceae bacterium]|nr:X2-like carbohydrate binding domain-containing protein [Oscillospiraceae bacterium]